MKPLPPLSLADEKRVCSLVRPGQRRAILRHRKLASSSLFAPRTSWNGCRITDVVRVAHRSSDRQLALAEEQPHQLWRMERIRPSWATLATSTPF
jgi:hypothetical protein